MSGKQWGLLSAAVLCLIAIACVAPVLLERVYKPTEPLAHEIPYAALAICLSLAAAAVAALVVAVWAVRLRPGAVPKACASVVGLLAVAVLCLSVLMYGLRDIGLHQGPFCSSQLKLLGLASLMYSQDYGDKLPSVSEWPVLLDPYMKNYGLFRCPEDKRGAGTAFAAPGWPKKGWLSYGANLELGGAKVGSIPKPAKAAWLFDCDLMKAAPDLAACRHNDGALFMYVDGHVGWLRARDLGGGR